MDTYKRLILISSVYSTNYPENVSFNIDRIKVCMKAHGPHIVLDEYDTYISQI